MSKAPLKPCGFAGCRELVRGTKYCDKHYGYTWKEDRRDSPAERGYDRAWARVRAQYARTHPLCEMCQARGIVQPVEIVHHIKPIADGGDKFKYANLQSLCRVCHGKAHSNDHGIGG